MSNTFKPAMIFPLGAGTLSTLVGLIVAGVWLTGLTKQKQALVVKKTEIAQATELENFRVEKQKEIVDRRAELGFGDTINQIILSDYTKGEGKPYTDWLKSLDPHRCTVVLDTRQVFIGVAFNSQFQSAEELPLAQAKTLCKLLDSTQTPGQLYQE